jgi:uncharacterized membrane protein YkvA (DUF1232 family)
MSSQVKKAQIIVETPDAIMQQVRQTCVNIRSHLNLRKKPEGFEEMIRKNVPPKMAEVLIPSSEYWDKWWENNLHEAKMFVALIPNTAKMILNILSDKDVGLKAKAPIVMSFSMMLALALIYLISPVDLIPDVIPIVGFLDDSMILMIAVTSFIRGIGRVNDKEEFVDQHWEGSPELKKRLLSMMNTANVLDRYAILDAACGAGVFVVLVKIVWRNAKNIFSVVGLFK